jgi:hypothetical protein
MHEFLETYFGGDDAGWLLLATISGTSGKDGRGIDEQTWFKVPEQLDKAIVYAESCEDRDLYFSPVLYSTRNSQKQSAKSAQWVWCDCDEADPKDYALPPTLTLETSPGHWQGHWLITEPISVDWAEAMSRQVTYSKVDKGSDKGGWARNKLMRVPGAMNTKPRLSKPFEVRLDVGGEAYSVEQMEAAFGLATMAELRSGAELPQDLPDKADVLARLPMDPDISRMLSTQPVGSWSEQLYALECSLFRLGLTAEEVFVVVDGCACDKYARQSRPKQDLWDEIKRCEADPTLHKPSRATKGKVLPREQRAFPVPSFITDDERKTLPRTFIDQYVDWAKTKTRADLGYHRLGAITVLATILSDFGHAVPQFGPLKLNLFSMILGETTGSYKSTSMSLWRMMLKPLIDEAGGYDYLTGGDVTTEGLLLALSERPSRSNLFIRDEVQQMLADGKNQRGYQTGLATTFTELYDGRVRGRLRSMGAQKKVPECETAFTMFTMGVPGRVAEVLDPADFASGFLARFVYYIGKAEKRTRESDRLEQAAEHSVSADDPELLELRNYLVKMRWFWSQRTPPGETIPVRCQADAWERYNQFISDCMDEAEQGDRPDLIVPSANRMTKATLKLATLLAMAEKKTEVGMTHMLNAIAQSEVWYAHLCAIASMIAETAYGAQMNKLTAYVMGQGKVKYSTAYDKFRMKPREFTELVIACSDAGHIKWTQDLDGVKWLEISS